MKTRTIFVVTFAPRTSVSEDSVGGHEWRVDPEDALQYYVAHRKVFPDDHIALFNMEVPADINPDELYDHVHEASNDIEAVIRWQPE